MSSPEPPWVEQYRSCLRRLANGQLGPAAAARVDLSGVVQQTLAECAGLAPPADPEDARRFVCQAFHRNLIDAIRHARAAKRDIRREESLESGDPLGSLAALSTPSQKAMRRESEEQLTRALAALPDDQRTAIVLHTLMELPYSQVAAEMGRSEEAVAGLYWRGVVRLRELLADPPSAT